MNIRVEGVVLRAVDYRESDRILTVLTREKGRITVKAAGCRRKSSRLSSACQVFCYSEMSLFERDGRYSLDDAFVKAQFYGLCSDIEKMTLASYFAQVLMAEPEESPGSEGALRLALNSFYALEKGLYPLWKIKAAFELKYACLCGYAPDIACCHMCGGRGEGYVGISDGLRTCKECMKTPPLGQFYLDSAAFDGAQYIITCDLKRLFSFDLPKGSGRLLSDFCERYLLDKTEQGYKALQMYKTLTGEEVQV